MGAKQIVKQADNLEIRKAKSNQMKRKHQNMVLTEMS
jgi:hypothetical protein